MRSGRILVIFFIVVALLTGCGSGGGGSHSSSDGGGTTPPPAAEINVIPITVNGSLCSNSSFGYLNKPCVSVTICEPGTSTCQTINDVLLDTGSTGLRVFKQALNVSLTQVASGSGSLAECVQFGDGSSVWGPVQTADVILGQEPAVRVSVQVIDSTFGTLPTACGNADKSPADAGFNGVLGLGLFAEDCGLVCANISANGMYYACSGPDCLGSVVPLSIQVQNPVALLPEDNNGVVVQFPSVPLNGAPSADGTLLLGIGTRSNNVPAAVTTYAANGFGEFITIFNGAVYSSFIDTGSNGLFFPPPSGSLLPDCAFPNSAWFCPSSTLDLSATTIAATGSPSGVASFQIGNFIGLIASSNMVFSDIGGNSPVEFQWGLPFFLGRTVYVGLEGKTSSIGSGLYWAY